MICDALYLHIPFCLRKCPYCDFYSVSDFNDILENYTLSLLRAIEVAPPIGPLDTVYFGGGTPPLLGARRLARLLEAIDRRFTLLPDAEITLECNPAASLTADLPLLRKAGFNRLSMGMQSARNDQLVALGRLHNTADVSQAAEAALHAGFNRLSLDLMLATPGQTQSDIDAAIALVRSLGAEHLSAYLLKIEPDTPFFQRGMQEADPDDAADLYLYALAAMARAGYEQYEISNFCRNHAISRHNYKYWDCREYLGLGPSAHSFLDGLRFFFPRDLTGFVAAKNPFSLAIDDGPGGDLAEYLMLRLRLQEGVVFASLLKKHPDYDIEKLCKIARPFEKGGLLVQTNEALRLTPQGMLVSNALLGELLNSSN